MKYSLKRIAILVIWLFCDISQLSAQTPITIATAINDKLIPVTTLSPDSNFSDLQKLKPFLKDRNIVALGEATHGTHEFFVYKHRMLKFLITEMGFKTILIEADFAGTQLMNNYVLYGKDDPRNALIRDDPRNALQDMCVDPWSVQEMVDMVNWVKQYNSTQTIKNKVQFYGCDVQATYPAIASLRAYLTQNKEDNDEIESGFSRMITCPHIAPKDKPLIGNAIKRLQFIQFVQGDTALYNHYVLTLQQAVNDALEASRAMQSNTRDKYMAENCKWVYEHTNHNKMIVWAHNEHIAKAKNSTGLVRMGIYLANEYKNNYYAMGFGLNTGQIRAMNNEKKHGNYDLPVAVDNSADHIFSLCNTPNFILDFKSAADNKDIDTFLNQPSNSYSIGADYFFRKDKDYRRLYVQHKLWDTYDAIIFISQTSASMPFTTSN